MPIDVTEGAPGSSSPKVTEKLSDLSESIRELSINSPTQKTSQSSVSHNLEPSTVATDISSVTSEDPSQLPDHYEVKQAKNNSSDSTGVPESTNPLQTNENILDFSDEDDREEVILHVTNLPYRVRWQELKDLFRWMIPAENVIRTEVFLREDGRSSGTGIVKVTGHRTAEKCVDVFDNYEWMSQNISVQIDTPLTADQYPFQQASSDQSSSSSHLPTTSSAHYIQPPLYTRSSHPLQPVVGNPLMYGSLPYSNFLSSSGSGSHYFTPSNSFVSYPPTTGLQPQASHAQPRLFTVGEQRPPPQNHHPGFFRTTPLVGTNPNIMGGFGGIPEVAAHPTNVLSRNRVDRRKLFIGNVPYTTHWQELKDFLRTAGNIMRVDIVNSQDGRSKGFAIAVYGTEEDAGNAIETLDGKEFEGRILAIRYDRYPDSMLPGQIPVQPNHHSQPQPPIPDYGIGTPSVPLGQHQVYDSLAAAKGGTPASGSMPPDTFAMAPLPHSFIASPTTAHHHYNLSTGYAYPPPLYIPASGQPQSSAGLSPSYNGGRLSLTGNGAFTYQQ